MLKTMMRYLSASRDGSCQLDQIDNHPSHQTIAVARRRLTKKREMCRFCGRRRRNGEILAGILTLGVHQIVLYPGV